MKNFRRIFSIFAVFLVIFGLTGCKGSKNETLDTPTNLTINVNGVASWNSVKGADKYRVKVDSATHDTNTTSLDLKTLQLSVGDHSVSVAAVKGDKVSAYSSVKIYKIAAPETPPEVPTGLKVVGGVLSWNAVSGANKYRVYKGSELVKETTNLSYDLNSLELETGEYTFKVVALKGNLSSEAAQLVYHHDAGTPIVFDELLAILLLKIDEDYVPDMEKSDFDEDEGEYLGYLNVVYALTAYIEKLMQLNKSEELALDLFELLYNLSEEFSSDEESTPSALAIQGFIKELKDLPITNAEVAIVIIGLSEASLDFYLEQFEDKSSEEYAFNLNIKNTIEDNRELLEDSITVVLDFVLSTVSALTENLLTHLDNFIARVNYAYSYEEIDILKGEVVSVLKETLPSEEDFKLLIQFLVYVGVIFDENIEVNKLLDKGEMVASLLHLNVRLAVEVFDFITAEEMAFIVETAAVIREEIETVDEFGNYDYYFEFHADKAAELLLFVAGLVIDFVEENESLLAEFEGKDYASLLDTVLSYLVDNLIIPLILKDSEGDDLELEQQLLEMIFAEIFVDGVIQDVLNLLEVVKNLGYASLKEIVKTNQERLITIMEFPENAQSFEEFIQVIQVMIEEIILMNNALLDAFGEDDVEVVVKALRLPLIYYSTFVGSEALGMELDEILVLTKAVYEYSYDDLVIILGNLNRLNEKLLEVADGKDVYYLMFEALEFSEDVLDNIINDDLPEEMLATMALIIDALGEFLDAETRVLLNSTIDAFFNILKFEDETFVDLINSINLLDVEEKINDMIDFAYEKIAIFKEYDFENITVEEFSALMEAYQDLMLLFDETN